MTSQARTDPIEFVSNDCRVRRSALRLAPGLMGMNQDVDASGMKRGIDVMARFWMFAVVRVERGTVRYLQDGRSIPVPASRYAIFAPPFSIVEAVLDRSRSSSMALVSATVLANDIPLQAVLVADPPGRFPISVTEVEEFLRKSPRAIRIGRCIELPRTAARIKAAIDGSYTLSRPLSCIARRLGISPSTMSRSFKKAYGIPPVHYRHHLRIIEGMMRLLDGESVAAVCQDIGFNDLSHFYRHFRNLTLASPARYHVQPA